MRKINFIISLFFALTLSIGQVWADDPTISWDFKTLQTTSGTQSGITWETGKTGSASATTCTAANGLVLYGVATGGGYFQTTSAISGTITNVNIVSSNKKNTPKYTVYCSANGSDWTEIATDQTAGTKDHAVTGSYTYVKVANTTAATAQLAVASITVTYTASGGGGGSSKDDLTDEQLSWSAASANITFGDEPYSLPSLTNSIPVSLTYESTDETVATISNVGVVSVSKAGSTTIKAVFAGNDDYYAKTVSYTLTVNPAPLAPIEGGIIDELTITDFGVTSGSYTAFSAKQASNTGHSDAVYAGKVAKNSTNIQMNSIGSSNAGREIATTTSGGNAKRVEVIWGGTNTANRTLTVYGSNTAYSGEETASSGTSLGVITYTANAVSDHIDITGNYPYIQLLASGAMYFAKINITWVEAVAPAVAVPTISGDENFVSSTTVTLDCETEGADIYYTTNGDAPTSSSTHYTAPFTLNATATVKAIAIKAGTSSEVASKAFTKIEALTTMDAIFTAATTAGGTATDKYVTFDNWVVSAVSGSNAFVTDGTKGFIIYASSHGFAVGNILNGTAACKVQLYKGSAELTNLTNTTTGLMVTTGGTAATNTKTIDQLGAVNTGAVVTIENVTFNGTNLSDGTNTIKPYNKLFAYTMESGKVYNITGVIDYYDALQIMPRSAADVEEIVEEGAPETPTFSPSAGTYTSVQSVEISCTTEGATIYYTTDGTTPTSSSTPYTSDISVGETMTIKAIAIKNEQSSAMATAAYTINLPEDEETSKTWNLAVASYDENPTTDLIQWSGTYVSMKNERNGNSNTAVNNYIPTTQSSTRFYKNNKLTITPSGKKITSILFQATTTNYASVLANSIWTNAGASVDGSIVTVTPADGEATISAVMGNTCGFTEVHVNYTAIDLTKPATPTFSPEEGTYTEVQNVEISCTTQGATIYYTTDGSAPTNESTEYTKAISVGENMTIKAIAIKDSKSSSVATAAYTINLPEDEETAKTWDLTVVSCDDNPTDDLMQWTATYVTMAIAKGSGTKVTNYYPGTSGQSYTHTRFYKDNTLTFTPNGKQITSITFNATEASYAAALANSTWTNGSAEVSGSSVIVTVTNSGVVSATIGAVCRLTEVRVAYTAIDASIPANPTFSPAAGTYTSAQNVEISTTTEGATIYYTIDGSTPDGNSTAYTTAIAVEETMTIKAVAIKDSKSSGVATAAYTINLPLSTMQAVFDKATENGSTAQDVNIQFNNWVVSGISTDNKSVYVTDGSKGFIIYGQDHGFAVNDKLNGTITCSLKLYNNFAEIVGLTANATGLTVTHDGVVTPIVANIADLGAVNTGAPIILNNVLFNGTNLTDGTNTIQPYTTFFADAVTSLTENKYYNITGIYVHFKTSKEIAPRSAADIEELDQDAPEMTWYTSSTKATEIAANATHTINIGDAFAPVFETNSAGALTYSSSNATVATIDQATGVLTLKGVTGTTTITCAVAADADNNLTAGSLSFTLRVREAVAGENVVIVAQFNDGENDKWLAMKHDLTALEVDYSDGKIWNLSAEEQAAITWIRTIDGDYITFQDPSNDNYLKGSTSTTLSVAAGESGNYQWIWSEDGYYTTNASGTIRTFLYQGNSAKFKNFAVGNAGKTTDGGYSQLPVVNTAVFATTPVDPEPEEPNRETISENLTPGKIGTFCPSQNISAFIGASFYTITDIEYAGNNPYKIIFDEIAENESLQAGHSYIYVAEDSEIKGVKSGDQVANSEIDNNDGFIGWTVADTFEVTIANRYFMVYNNEIRLCGLGWFQIPAGRAIIDITKIQQTGSAPAPGRRRVSLINPAAAPQVTTDIDALTNDGKAVKVIINDKMFIIRNGQMFDTTGRLVK